MSDSTLRLGLLDLFDAMARPACPVCRSVRRREERYLASLAREYANDAAARDALVRTPGFCTRHTWLLTAVEHNPTGAPVGASLLLDALLGEWVRRLEHASASSTRRGPCPVCSIVGSGTDAELRELVQALDEGDQRIRARYETSDGLCAEHLTQLVAVAPDSPGRRGIVELAVTQFDHVRQQLQEFDRKRQWSARGEARGQEQNAWRRAALLLGGAMDELSAQSRGSPWTPIGHADDQMERKSELR